MSLTEVGKCVCVCVCACGCLCVRDRDTEAGGLVRQKNSVGQRDRNREIEFCAWL